MTSIRKITPKIRFTLENIINIPNQAGVYILWRGVNGKPYIGSAGAGRLKARLLEHYRQKDKRGITSFQYKLTGSTEEARKWEKYYRDKLNPTQRI